MIDNPPDRPAAAAQPAAPQPEGNMITDALGATGITGLLGGLMKTLVGISELDKGNMNPLMSVLEGKQFAPTRAEEVMGLQKQTQANQARRNDINDTFKQAWLQSTTEQNRLNNEIKKTQVNQGQQRIDALPIAAAKKGDKVDKLLSNPELTEKNLQEFLNMEYPNEKDAEAKNSLGILIREKKGWPVPKNTVEKIVDGVTGLFSSKPAPASGQPKAFDFNPDGSLTPIKR